MFRATQVTLQHVTKRQASTRRFATVITPLVKVNVQQTRQYTSTRLIAGTTLIGAVSIGSYFMLSPSIAYCDAETEYTGAVEDQSTRIPFPVYLNTNSDWKRLVGLGVRQVSFMKINVYVLGLYMKSEDIGELQRNAKWKNFDKSEFLEKEELALTLLEAPVDVSVRIVPVRNTNTQHLRDGFTRSLLQRMRQQSKTLTEEQEKDIVEAIRDFKAKFVNAKVTKGTEFVFTKTKSGEFKMEYEGKDMGTVKNKWLAVNFIMTYLSPEAPASEDALLNIATGFDSLMQPSQMKQP